MGHEEDIEHQSSHQCQKNCNTTLPCGHVCASLCHKEDSEHKGTYKCPVNCKQLIVCGLCSDPDNRHVMPCGHSCSLLCHSRFSEPAKCHVCPDEPTSSPPPPADNCNFSDESIPTMIFYGPIQQVCTSETAKDSDMNSPGGMGEDENLATSKVSVFKCSRGCEHSSSELSCPSFSEHMKFLNCEKDSSTFNHPNECNNNSSINIDPKESCTLGQGTDSVNDDTSVDRKPIVPGHTCNGRTWKCYRLCKAVLSCGHKCRLRCLCHVEYPHSVNDRCNDCSLTDPKKSCALDKPGGFAIEPAERATVNTTTVSGHTCKFVEGKCYRLCKAVLSCGHKCRLKCLCHVEYPHSVFDRCNDCSLTDPKKTCAFDKPAGFAIEPAERATVNTTTVSGHTCKFVEGKCYRLCKAVLSCGHKCRLKCLHHVEYPHSFYDRCNDCCLTDPEKTCAFDKPAGFAIEPADRATVNTTMVSGHTCKFVEGKCYRLCKAVLSCGHKCLFRCLVPHYPHSAKDECISCSLTNTVQGNCPNSKNERKSRLFRRTLKLARLHENMILWGHNCHLKKGKCWRQCEKLLSCGHKCPLVCHLHKKPHGVDDRCAICLSTGPELANSQIELNCDVLLNCCLHQVMMDKCKNVCPGMRLCGHPCKIAGEHKCVDHYGYKCLSKCKVVMMPCRHMCIKTCHVGDPVHKCVPMFPTRCKNALDVESYIPKEKMKTLIAPGHPHKLVGYCQRMCKTKLSCGHTCTLRCCAHKSYPHLVDEKCFSCRLPSVALWEDLKSISGEHEVKVSSDCCSHYVEDYKCEQVCRGRLCGHPCGLSETHLCSHHAASDKCQAKCGVRLSCQHKCSRTCHVGDYTHECKLKVKKNKKPCINAGKCGHELESQDIQACVSKSDQSYLFNIDVGSIFPCDESIESDCDDEATGGSDFSASEKPFSAEKHLESHLDPLHTNEQVALSISNPHVLQKDSASLQMDLLKADSSDHCNHQINTNDCKQSSQGCWHHSETENPHERLGGVNQEKIIGEQICNVVLSCGCKCSEPCSTSTGYVSHDCVFFHEESCDPEDLQVSRKLSSDCTGSREIDTLPSEG